MSVQFVDRKGTYSLKWDMLDKIFGDPDLLSMWVADMDIRTPDCVQEALQAYMATGAYGYAAVATPFKNAFVAWERDRHGFEVDPSWVKYAPGVVPAIYWSVLSMTEPGDAVLVLPPVYYPFFGAGESRDRKLVESRLVNDGAGRWSMDLADIEAKIVAEDVKMLIFCSPHNPLGRVWSRGELEGLYEVCRRHGVIVVSDEIHQDFVVAEGARHVPFGTVGTEGVVMLTAPSKTFNLAGLKTAVAVIPDEGLREKWEAYTKRIHMQDCNSLGFVAGAAAYAGGAQWVDELCGVVRANFERMRDGLLAAYPQLVVTPLEGTYLMFVDFGAYVPAEDMDAFFKQECRIAIDYGSQFKGGADTWARFNLATSPENIDDAVARIVSALGRRGAAEGEK